MVKKAKKDDITVIAELAVQMWDVDTIQELIDDISDNITYGINVDSVFYKGGSSKNSGNNADYECKEGNTKGDFHTSDKALRYIEKNINVHCKYRGCNEHNTG